MYTTVTYVAPNKQKKLLFFRRVTAFGCECGYVRISRVCVKTNTEVFSHSTRFDNYITSLRIFPESGEPKVPKCICDQVFDKQISHEPLIHVAVTNSILPPIFFWFVLTTPFTYIT